MPTIIDSFLVTFGIDPTQYNRGQDDIRRQNKKTRDQLGESDKDLQKGAKRNAESIGKLKTEVTGLLLAFAGASTIKGFIGDLIHGDAALGRLASNLGVSTSELGAWELAAKQAGGEASDADAAFKMLVSTYQDYHLRGLPSISADLIQLGVSEQDWAKPTDALLKLAEASERMDRSQFYDRASKIGIPDSVITTLTKGRKATEEYIAQLQREASVSKRNTDEAAAFEKALADLEARLKDGVRPALYEAVSGLLALTNNAEVANTVIPVMVGLMGALAIEVVAATWPFLLLAAGIASATAAYRTWKAEHDKDAADTAKDPRPHRSRFMQKVFDMLGINPKLPPGVLPAFKDTPAAAGGGGGAPSSDAAYLKKAGLRDDQIQGILAGMKAEGGGLGMAANGAFGLGQWRGPRLAALRKRYGNAPTRQEQLEFLVGELRGGDAGGPAVLAQTGALATMEAYIKSFMRPGPGTAGDLDRGRRALGIRPGVTAGGGRHSTSTSSTTIGSITVYTPGTDANGIARDLNGAIRRRLNTTHANTGID